MDMDDDDVILHQFDTIWFFSNALFSPPSPKKPNQPPQAPETPDDCESRAPPEQTRNEAGSVDGGAEESAKERFSEHRRKRSGGNDKENRASEGLLHLELRSAPERRKWEGRRRVHNRRAAAFGSCLCNLMPCTGDEFAMKEHLKSWAHAVACAVR